MRHFITSLLIWMSFIIPIGETHAREIARDAYLKQVPLRRTRLVQQTPASATFHLYGDRYAEDYRDVHPVDGMDDERHEILRTLAVRFAPFLVQNSSNFPTNFEIYIENRESFALNVDTWDITGADPRLIESRGVNLSVISDAECESPFSGDAFDRHPLPTANGAIEDCKLLEILDDHSPWVAPMSDFNERVVRARPELFQVLFFDWPGQGPESWEIGYQPEYERTCEERRNSFPHAFVHPFLVDVVDELGVSLGYEFVLQYWFFYPSNDSGMNHEGDWEHLNVVISPRSEVEHPMPAGTIQKILTGELPASDDASDPLVIKRVDYYFHHLVMTLDFSSPNVYEPRERWKAEVKRCPKTRFQQSEIWEAIRQMAYEDDEETVVNTHPFGYIGADNKGLDQALAAPGGKNRNSHGTFPFPGRYQNSGPGGTNDQISVYTDPRRYLRDLKAGKQTTGPEFKRGSVIGLAHPDRVTIVPDWERLVEPTRSSPRARRDWSWVLLPIRWGYPATESPFSGVLEHFDTGNVAPVGPSFNPGWNAVGPAPGYGVYDPHALPSIFPLGFQDGFRNDLGFLNLTVPVLINLPPLDFATRVAAYPVKRIFGRRDPVYYPKESLPFRFVGISSGVSVQKFSNDYGALALNPAQLDEFVLRLVLHLAISGADSTTAAVGGRDFVNNSMEPFYHVAFYFGGRFASENTVRNARSKFGIVIDFNNIPSWEYSAELNFWEYAGSFRYSFSASRFQPFLKGGYGWSWYRVENVSANGVPFALQESDWIRPKGIWPGVWHFGIGFEFIPWKRSGKLPGGLDVSMRFEYGRYYQSLGLDLSGISLSELGLLFRTLGDVPGNETVTRDDFLFGLTLSF